MSITGFSPAQGYPTASSLKKVVKDSAKAQLQREAGKLASQVINPMAQANQRLSTKTIASGLQGAAVNSATNAARSVSEKLNGALGGKLSSVLGSGLPSKEGLMNAGTKQLTNLATGAVQKVSSMAQNKLGSALTSALGKSAGGLLGNTLSKVPDGAAKNLAGAKVAAGFLEHGPKDDALVVDPYGVSDNGILNNLTEAAGGMFQNAIESLRRSPDLITDLTSMVLTGDTNFSMIKDNMVNRVVSSLGGQYGIMNSISGPLKDSIVGGAGLPEGIFDTAMMVVNGQMQRFQAGGVDNARQVYALVNQITNHSNLNRFFDIGSESALMAGVMRELIALGIPESINVLVEKAPHEEVAYNALYANMRAAVEYSDLDTINMMLDQLGPTTFLSRVPDAVQVLLTNYELPVGTTDENYDTEWTALKACLDKMMPGWGRVKRDGVLISDLSFYSTLSVDAQRLMRREPDYLIAATIGPSYQGAPDLIGELKRRYPLVPL